MTITSPQTPWDRAGENPDSPGRIGQENNAQVAAVPRDGGDLSSSVARDGHAPGLLQDLAATFFFAAPLRVTFFLAAALRATFFFLVALDAAFFAGPPRPALK